MSKTITLTAADGHELSAYHAGHHDAPHALVVVQEIFGVNHNIRSVADRFAEQGFHVVAPALFDRAKRGVELGYSPDDMKEGLALRAAIPLEATLADLRACVAHFHTHAPHRKVGVIGFCWGGTLAWDAATKTRDFAAAVGWYGAGIAKHVDAQPHCPVQLHFGGQDASIPPQDIRAIREKHPDVEIFVYDDAGHGFGNRDRASSYNAQAEHLAWSRSVTFLEACLHTSGNIPDRS
ncbi:dienelactone hydrolase family protein [Acetobacter estunensis]|uniref:Dienelactone hydrolase family protein n=1 Tax=Acetobacter estunensis TaxID=104097 RepID=A0A967BA85_9PROT|nr:dienelactone hydrolase family protein [Acetobacter estunensis]NHO54826.1 dienelactone hydrolase family protein [Acetobacter estunensis]